MSDSRGVIVLGIYRSGTSLTCRILDRLGVGFGPADAFWRADQFNPAGYYERLDVNDANGKLLEAIGHSFVVPPEPEELASFDADALPPVDLSWTDAERWWGLKDPRLCATLDVWFQAKMLDPDRLWFVNVQRETRSIIDSVLRYPPFQERFGTDEQAARRMIERYRRLHQWQLERLEQRGRPLITIGYEQLLDGPRAVVEQLAGFLEIDDRRRVRRAAAVVGLRRARRGYQLRRVARKLGRMVGWGGPRD